MLVIKTELKNINWLIYILDEFKRCNLADFDIQLRDISDTRKYKNTIYYLNTPYNNITIYNCKKVLPDGELLYVEDNLFILSNSICSEFTVNYDIFWNAFVFLSRYEEYTSEINGKYIHSYSQNHPRKDKNSFNIPIVNILFNKIEVLIKENFKDLKFNKKQKMIIDYSHDVDYINKTIQLRLKQSAFNGFNTLKSINNINRFSKNIIKTFKFAFSNPSYNCFDYWLELEKKYNNRSIFYVYVETENKNLKSWLIDPSYNIFKDQDLKIKLKKIKNNGFDIGLHGSYYSANSLDLLKKEKELLEEITGFEITRTRQHWLNYYEKITPYLHNKLFKTDSTLGWNDRIGFRSGITGKYRPYDHKNDKPFNYDIVPQVIMDSNIYDYSNNKSIFVQAKNMINNVNKVSKTACISISWHQRVCNSDYNWHILYEELLNDL